MYLFPVVSSPSLVHKDEKIIPDGASFKNSVVFVRKEG